MQTKMSREVLISNIILQMREYQRLNGITKKCVDNNQFLLDIINVNGGEVEVKPYIVVYTKNDVSFIMTGHLAINFKGDDDIIEPSYEIWSLPEKAYFGNIEHFVKSCSFPSAEMRREMIQETAKDFIDFVDLARKINSGELVLTDRNYYDRQADFIEDYLRKQNYKFTSSECTV
jgi:hypothetical protein